MKNGNSILQIWVNSRAQSLSMLPTHRFVNHLPLWLKRKLHLLLQVVWMRQWWKSKSAFCDWFLPIVFKAWVRPNLIRSNVFPLKTSKHSTLNSMVCLMPTWRFNSIWARATFPVKANCPFPKSSAIWNKPTAATLHWNISIFPILKSVVGCAIILKAYCPHRITMPIKNAVSWKKWLPPKLWNVICIPNMSVKNVSVSKVVKVPLPVWTIWFKTPVKTAWKKSSSVWHTVAVWMFWLTSWAKNRLICLLNLKAVPKSNCLAATWNTTWASAPT